METMREGLVNLELESRIREKTELMLSRRVEVLVSAKEKLMREEYERKFQELELQVKQERNRYRKLIDETKQQLAGCICRAKSR